MIENLEKMGRLKEKIPSGPDLTDADLRTARSASFNGNASAKDAASKM